MVRLKEEMKLVPDLFGVVVVLRKGLAGDMELGRQIA